MNRLKFLIDYSSLFFLSAAVFGLLVLLSPVVSTLLLGMQLHIVFAAPILAIALGSTIMVALSVDLKNLLVPLIPASVAMVFHSLTHIQRLLDNEMFAMARQTDKAKIIESLAGPVYRESVWLVLAIIAIPYLLYGMYLTSLLTEKRSRVSAVLASEFLGALAGTVGLILLLESAGFQPALLFVIICGVAAACILPVRKRLRIFYLMTGLTIATAIYSNRDWFEPQRNVSLIVRDFQQKTGSELVSESWTSYAKVQTIKVAVDKQNRQCVALGDGTGLAEILLFDPGKKQELLTPFGKIQRVLNPKAMSAAVLFAGAGRDMIDLHYLLPAGSKLTGVEINPEVISHAIRFPGSRLSEFFNHSDVDLKIMDARHFLDRNENLYDLVLFSWSGATVAHYSGAILHTTQLTFTMEALQAATRSLNKNGYLMITGGSKINILLSLKELQNRGHIPLLSQSVVLMSEQAAIDPASLGVWDNLILVWKNGQFTQEEVKNLKAEKPGDQLVVWSPFDGGVPMLTELITSEKSENVIKRLRELTGVYFDNFTDDRPFVYNAYNPKESLSFRWPAIKLALACLVVPLFIFGLCYRRRANSKTPFFGAASFISGFVGVFLQIVFVFRLLSFVSNPGHVLLLGVGAGFLASSVGFLSASKFKTGQILLFCGTAGGLQLLTFKMLPLPLLVGVFFLFTVSLSALFLTFLQSTPENPMSTKLFFCFDAWGGVCASLLAPVILQNFGFNTSLTLLGLVLALVIGFGFFGQGFSSGVLRKGIDR